MPHPDIGRTVRVLRVDPQSTQGAHTLPIGATGVILSAEHGVYLIRYGRSTIQYLIPSEFALLSPDGLEPAAQVGQTVRIIDTAPDSPYGEHCLPIGSYGRITIITDDGGFRIQHAQHFSYTQTLVRSEFMILSDMPAMLIEERETMPNTTECLDCNDTVLDINFCESCNSCHECCSCQSESENYTIQDASCRAYPEMRPFPAPTPHFLYLGVELEVEIPSGDRQDVARRLKKDYSDDILIKGDGSLDDGFEMVSGPFSIEEHKLLWPNLLPVVSKLGARSWSHSTTGLHVHLSRAFFTPLVLGKLLVFLNSEATRAHIVVLAGRECPDFAAMAKKKLTDVVSKKKKYNYRDDTYTCTRERVCRGNTTSRYEALNLQNEKTVEIRIFKGTLNIEHVLADIEFCHAAAYWVTNCSIQDCENWSSFWSYVLAHKKEYTELVKYMSSDKRNRE